MHQLPMTLHGSIWLHMTPYVSLWLSMSPYSSLWFPIAPYDTHMAHYESYVTLSNMQLFMKFLNSPWLSMALYDLIWIPMSACDFLWLPIAPYGFKIIDSFGHKMFISSQSKLCIWSKNFFDKSCSVWLPNKGNVIKSQDYRVIWSQNVHFVTIITMHLIKKLLWQKLFSSTTYQRKCNKNSRL